MYNRNLSAFLILLMEFLERAGYYGMRAVLVLYLTAERGLNMNSEEVLPYYGYFALVMVMVEVPLGVITDFLLKQKRAIAIGGGLAVVGYLMLLGGSINWVIGGVVFIVIGTGLVSPNLNVLLGRLYDKRDRQRDTAFLARVGFINLGSFLGVLLLGFIGAQYSYELAFGIAAYLSFLYWLTFLVVNKNINEVEENLTIEHTIATNETILDADSEEDTPQSKTNYWMVFLLIVLATCYAYTYDLVQLTNQQLIPPFEKVRLLGLTLPSTVLMMLSTVIGILATLVLWIVWSIKKRGSSIRRLGTGMLLLVVTLAFCYLSKNWEQAATVPLVILSLSLVSLAETLLLSVGTSYLTRVSNVRYSSTTLGVYTVLFFVGGLGLAKVSRSLESDVVMLATMLIVLALATVMFTFRKELIKLSGDID